MPTGPVQQLLLAFEISLMLMGAFMVFRLAWSDEQRARWLETNRLARWPVTVQEFALFVFLVLACGFVCQGLVQLLLRNFISGSDSRAGFEIFAYGAGFHGGGLMGWLLFPRVLKRWQAYDGAMPPAEGPAPKPAWPLPAIHAVGTILTVLPLLIVGNIAWTWLLGKLGLPDEPQDLIAIFANTKSPLILGGMLVVACVLAPINEELLFRAGLYRFCRQRLGRNWALLISGGLFGAVHGNLAGFLPLALLGMGLALAYEATGDIRVSIIAHGLFNLNTIIFILSGLPQ